MRSGYYLSFTVLLIAVFSILLVHSRLETKNWQKEERAASRQLVNTLALTDLAIWTEARYTRHPALADFFTPFQDFPASLEHFPAGSIIAPSKPAVGTSLQIVKKPSGATE